MTMKTVLLMLAVLMFAVPMFAQATATPAAAGDMSWAGPAIAAVGMGIASGLCGLGQGRATASAAEAMARNPGAAAQIRGVALLGLVLIESLALYTLLIIFLKVNSAT